VNTLVHHNYSRRAKQRRGAAAVEGPVKGQEEGQEEGPAEGPGEGPGEGQEEGPVEGPVVAHAPSLPTASAQLSQETGVKFSVNWEDEAIPHRLST
jgi:hypothetical protein